MRTARPIQRRDIVLTVRDRWLNQYKSYADDQKVGWSNKTAGQIRKELAALDLAACAPADVDAVLGTSGWAKNECDECDEDFPVVIQVGQEPDYEARWQNLCPTCLAELAAFAATVEPKP